MPPPIPPEAAKALRSKIRDHRWTASTNSDGYPKVKIQGESRLASHVLLQLEGRPVPTGKVVMHRDNDLLNLDPKNLRIGTQQQNLKQMRDEGRDRPRGVSQEPDMKKRADAVDDAAQMAAGDFYRNRTSPYARAAAERLGGRLGLPGAQAYGLLKADAEWQGVPVQQHLGSMLQQHGLSVPDTLLRMPVPAREGPLPTLRKGNWQERLQQANTAHAAPAQATLEGGAPHRPPGVPPVPAPPAPLSAPRPRPGFQPINPSPLTAGASAAHPSAVPPVPPPRPQPLSARPFSSAFRPRP